MVPLLASNHHIIPSEMMARTGNAISELTPPQPIPGLPCENPKIKKTMLKIGAKQQTKPINS